MKIKDFFVRYILRRQEPVRRVIECGGVKAPPHRKKHRHKWRDDAEGAPEPEVVRRKVRPVKPYIQDMNVLLPEAAHELIDDLNHLWTHLHFLLQNEKRVRIGPNDHYGKLRGVDILRIARRDFRRAGIPVNVKLCGQHGFISLASNDSNR